MILVCRRHVRAFSGASVFSGIVLLFCLCSTPCLANVAPESAILIHVQPVSGTCETTITNCSEMVRTTNEEGLLEFFIFFFKSFSWWDQQLCIHSLQADLVWPESWQYIDFDPCSGSGWIEPTGSTHLLEMSWWNTMIPDEPAGVFLVGRIILNVRGPGRLDFVNLIANPVELVDAAQSGCWGTPFVTQAVGVDAEAGMDCEYTTMNCAGHEVCVAEFFEPELVLSALTGGVAHGQVEFWAENYMGELCDLAIDTRADWAEAEIEYSSPGHAYLQVTADASGLYMGVYQTEIQLSEELYFHVARCLPVVFTVENPTPGRRASWGWIKSIYR